MSRRKANNRLTLKAFVRDYNKYALSFTSWTIVRIEDYKARTRGSDVNSGNAILCINTSTSDTMKRMLLAYYLAIRNNNQVYFTYIWSGEDNNPKYIEAILDDMSLIISAFVEKKYKIKITSPIKLCKPMMEEGTVELYKSIIKKRTIGAFVTMCMFKEAKFTRTMYKSASIKEIYYSSVVDKSGVSSYVSRLSLNIAKSIAKGGTLIISGDDIMITPKDKYNNSNIDNNIKASLTNPLLIDITAVYNNIIPRPMLVRQIISLATTSTATLDKEPVTVIVYVNIKPPKLAFDEEDLESFIERKDIDFDALKSEVKKIERYYHDLGIGDYVARPGEWTKAGLVKYLLNHMTDKLINDVYDMETEGYIFIESDV